MNLLEQNYKVIYEDRSLAFTEAPVNAKGLMRQRFRWSFGILQAVFKHKQAFRTNPAMGFFALPNILVFQILLPLVSPFIDLMFIASLFQYLWQRYFHPEAASAVNFEKLLVYFLTFLIIDFVTSALAFSLERKHPAARETACCSSTSGCSASPTGRCFRWYSSRRSSARSMVVPLTGTSSSAPRRCPSRPRALPRVRRGVMTSHLLCCR